MSFDKTQLDIQCRACMCRKIKFQKFNKISEIELEMKVYEIFKYITPELVIQESDGLPQYICVGCLFKLKHAYQFQQMCIESDKKYRGTVKIKEEVKNVSDTLDATAIETTSSGAEASIPTAPLTLYVEQTNIDGMNNATEANQTFSEQPKTTLIASMKVKLSDEYCTATSQNCNPLENDEGRFNKNEIYICTVCDKVFKSRILLLKHTRLHSDEKSYVCPHCSKDFKSRGTLREHIKRHSENKTYQCPHCPSKFSCRSDVSKHQATHNKTKDHVCEICGSVFQRFDSLTFHRKIHTGNRPHKCERCPATFIAIGHLKQHMRTHTGEKPYKCQYCHRAFTQSYDLNKHIRLHVGDKIYNCTQCKEAFKYLSELREHRTQHKGEIQEKSETSETLHPEVVEDIIIKEETILST